MSWEDREGKTYYYRAVRREGRTIKEYVGRGPVAELAARLDARAHRQRAWFAEALAIEVSRSEAAERATREYEVLCELLTSAWMYAEGYHRHRSGPWRKRRAHG